MANERVKSAIVTGASGGIGRVVARKLAGDRFAIMVCYAGNPAKAEAVVTEITSTGARAIAVQADVADAAAVERLFAQTIARPSLPPAGKPSPVAGGPAGHTEMPS